jgi:hypothetical protein
MSDPTSFIGQTPGVEISQGYQVLNVAANTGLFKMIVGVLTTCHAQYT